MFAARWNWYLNLLRLKFRMARKWSAIQGHDPKLDMANYIDLFKEIWQDAAKRLSAEFSEVSRGIWKIAYEDRVTVIFNFKVQIDDPVVLNIASNKALCYRLMVQAGLSVPDHQTFTLQQLEKAKDFMERFQGGSFVVKPGHGTAAGRGVTTHIESFKECFHATALASLFSDEMIIERFIPGESYRLLVLNDRVIHASRRRGLRIKGNGQSTIGQLVENERRHRINGKRISGKIKPDRDYQATLKAQGLTSHSIPEAGKEILVKGLDNPSGKNIEVCTFYNENVTSLICQDLRDQAIRAARILNSKFAGVDIITLDPTLPLKESGGVINEINTTPGLHHHYNLHNAEDLPPAVHVLKYLLKIKNF